MIRAITIHLVTLRSIDTCRDIFVIKNTHPDFLNIRGKEYCCTNFLNDAGQSVEREGREKECLCFARERVERAFVGRVFNEFPGSIANNTFHGDERKGRPGCWRVS